MLLQTGKAFPETLGCREGDPEWKPLSELGLVPLPDLSLPRPPHAAAAPRAAWSEVRGNAALLQFIGAVFLVLAGLFTVWLLVAWLGSDQVTPMNLKPPAILSACSLSAGLVLALFAQLLHIRAAIEQRS